MLRSNSRASRFSLCDSHERCFCVWAREYACVCATSEQDDTVVRKPLYRYVAHINKFWSIYDSARGEIVINVVNLNYFHSCCCSSATTTAAVEKARLSRYNSRRSSSSLCDSQERCFGVWVRERAFLSVKREQRHIYRCHQP